MTAVDARITTALEGRFTRAADSFGTLVLEIERERLLEVVARLRHELGFALFLDVTAVDHLGRTPRFDVVYHFLSPAHRKRVRLKLRVGEDDATVPTLTGIYGAARFMEREAHEMYGIRFADNDDLRPILLYEGFTGHPLRKDYAIDREQPIVPYRK
jgi:NADH-quinone oxidoreductase subunit C